VSPRIFCGVLVSACVLLACATAPASAATNLVTNPGFETQGSVQTVFSDTIPDGDAWRSAAGGYTYGGNAITSFGVANTTDIAIIQYSQDWSDTTMTVTTTPLATSANLVGGAMVRWQSGVGYYGCGVRSGALVIQRRSSNTDTVLGSTGLSVQANASFKVTFSAVGSTLTCSAVRTTGGATTTLTRTDTTLTSGVDGTFAINDTNQTRQFRFSAPSVTAAVPSGWSTIVPTAGRPGLVPDRVAAANSGDESLQLFSGDESFAGYAGQTVTVTPSTTYTLEAAISTIALTSGTARVVVTESPSGVTTTLGSVSGTTPWTLYSTSFTTRSNTTSVTVRPTVNGLGRGSFDDISLGITPQVSLALSSSSIEFGTVDPLSSPYSRPSALTATVTANAPWALTVAGTGDFGDGLGKAFPLARLGWRLNGSAGAYTPLSTAATTVTSGGATSPTGSANPLDMQLTVTYADPISANSFQTSLTYIAFTP
jgi:hypothetical protein